MSETETADTSRLRGMTVLLAEDNVTNQLVATQMLKTLGVEVDVASDGAIALDLIDERTYDVLLIDIEMPRVSGLDVIRSVRSAAEPLASTPIVALTAYAMQEHREKIEGAGADGLIPKPLTSIEKFGLDILSYMDSSAKRVKEPERPGAVIERTIFDSLATSIGAEAMAELLEKLEIDLRKAKEDIAAAARDGDADLMRGSTHILISVAGSVGGVRLQRQAEELNRLAHDSELEGASDLTDAALVELDGVIAFVAKQAVELAG